MQTIAEGPFNRYTEYIHHGHTSTRAERSCRWLADVLEASRDCLKLVTYGYSIKLQTLTEPQCFGLIVVISTAYLLLLPIRHCSNLVGSEWRLKQMPPWCHLSETAWWPIAVSTGKSMLWKWQSLVCLTQHHSVVSLVGI